MACKIHNYNVLESQNDDILIQDLDDESVLETVDFSEFETLFQVNRYKKNPKLVKQAESEFLSHKIKKLITNYIHADLRKASEQLCLIESRRARNLGANIYILLLNPI